MFNTAISMRELELESAELLPRRETLCVLRHHWGGPWGWGGGGEFFNEEPFFFGGGEPFFGGGCGFNEFNTFAFEQPFEFGGCGI